ncbi:hypothetical protein H632_c2949p1 [Helicosporidium sp. ATCC 50920]|nr:hypothetical protein H632_c2949p1 [Helicosporidium sp. ATCC 50920]|eukprot:KDD72744.1 hypothetical protein H632_c2949p1 [Helicosporidium sp. ATCC 50920]
MLSVGASVYYRPRDRAVHADAAHAAFARGSAGDHGALVAVFRGWADAGFSTQWCYEHYVQARSMKRARDVREQVLGLLERCEVELRSNPEDGDALRKAVTAGYFYNVAALQRDGRYKTVKKPQTVHVHPSSALAQAQPRWIVFHELVLTTKEYARVASEIKPDWLVDVAPHFYSRKEVEAQAVKKLPKSLGKAAGKEGG